MCGISGLYNPSGLSGAEHGIDRMTSLLSHRGPDANGKYVSANCALGHARLSIIDLNDRSNQPMWSACGRYVMVYNGEVYNYGEIALQIYGDHKGGAGFKLKTSGDSEVVLEAFALYGPSFVQLLNGMFAIAIYDTQSEELFLFRDRLGIKPLFYYHKESSVVFASELKAIVANDFVEKKVLSSGLFEFMQLGFVPAPLTIYQDIYKLPGGCYLKAGHAGVEVIKYWDLESIVLPQTYTDPNEVTVRLCDLLTSSVQYQMRSDVPYGVFLSGGVDSSLITAQAVSLSSSRISTFSIGFAEKRYNESSYARSVAEYLGTDHHEFIVGYEDALALVENITDVYDEPFADSSCIPTMLVSKLARSKVTVALSGDGGDELFFGYGSHQWARRMGNPLARMMRYPVSMVFSHLSPRLKRVGELLDYPEGTNLMKHIFGQEQYLFSESSAHSLLSNEHRHQMGEELRTNRYTPPKFSYDYFENLLISGGLKRRLNRMEMQAFYDVISYLQDDLLAKVDRASMKFSLEGRVPFLDHRIVEFAINIDPKMKYSDGVPKYILKEVLYHFLPEKIFDRPKQGFSIPLEKWLGNELSFLLDQYLSEDSVLNTGLFDWSAVKKIKDRFQKGDSWCYNRIWSLLMVQIWYYRNFKT